jgi:prephenate dehydrogenase
VLDGLLDTLGGVRDVVAGADRDRLLGYLERARQARVNLPTRAARADDLVEMRVPIPDRPGVLAEVTTLAGDLGVNIEDLEIAHSAEGERGVLLLVIDAKASDLLRGAFLARGYRPSVQPLAP